MRFTTCNVFDSMRCDAPQSALWWRGEGVGASELTEIIDVHHTGRAGALPPMALLLGRRRRQALDGGIDLGERFSHGGMCLLTTARERR